MQGRVVTNRGYWQPESVNACPFPGLIEMRPESKTEDLNYIRAEQKAVDCVILDKGGASDCGHFFAEFSTQKLFEIFNTQAGRDEMTKTDCRRMFILTQELLKRGIDFNIFKGFDENINRHFVCVSDAVELLGTKINLTIAGRMKYM